MGKEKVKEEKYMEKEGKRTGTQGKGNNFLCQLIFLEYL